jgi:hypothetical protein
MGFATVPGVAEVYRAEELQDRRHAEPIRRAEAAELFPGAQRRFC